ncbi:MAG: mechanosensitive ion channel family protein [Lysobacter sp.]|jgi:small-conductance mechanosensitive channel|nr:mechanosensitive ion channel family protein [Lysobacter sp.]MDV5981294.1 mechanosensitive ion channel family protein [Lysobacter sp.]
MTERLPPWIQEWLTVVVPLGQVLLILLAAWLLRAVTRRVVDRLCTRRGFPPELAIAGRRVIGFLIYAAALLLVLERLGVSGTVLWTAFTGFAAVGAVAFFAAWSVLSNIFCTVLILTTRPFRLYDHIEILENGEKPGLKGRVIDVNLVYTTLQEQREDGSDTVLRVPNNLFFQRTVRRWRTAPAPPQTSAGEPHSEFAG